MSQPELRPRPSFRVSGDLAVGASLSNGVVVDEIVPIAGSARLRVRFKASAAGALDVVLMGPNTNTDTEGGTQYSTGNPTQVAVSANTEAKIDVDLYGESWALIKYTPSGSGTITYVDVSQV